jgi:hypothetical protein
MYNQPTINNIIISTCLQDLGYIRLAKLVELIQNESILRELARLIEHDAKYTQDGYILDQLSLACVVHQGGF